MGAGLLVLAAGGVAGAAIMRAAGDDDDLRSYSHVQVPGPTVPEQPGPTAPVQPGAALGQPEGTPTAPDANGAQVEPTAQPSGPAGALPSRAASSTPGALLTEAQAKDLALARIPGGALIEAGAEHNEPRGALDIVSTQEGAVSIQLHLDYDDGRYVYEGEIIRGQDEYDFELDAVTGRFIEWEHDSDHR
jgi:uncharacterized membrane protein YkoI